MTSEGIQQAAQVVEIDGMLYLHQNGLEGMGQIVDISTSDEMDSGVFKFYLGEQGLTSLDIFGMQGRGCQVRRIRALEDIERARLSLRQNMRIQAVQIYTMAMGSQEL